MNRFFKIYYRSHDLARVRAPGFYGLLFSYRRIVKYFISGCTAAAVDIITLFILTDIAHIWYLLSAILAFLVALGISFTLQKFWAFRDMNITRLHVQVIQFSIVAVISLGINSLLMYIAVDFFHLHYILAQIVVGVIIAVTNFFGYTLFVFNR